MRTIVVYDGEQHGYFPLSDRRQRYSWYEEVARACTCICAHIQCARSISLLRARTLCLSCIRYAWTCPRHEDATGKQRESRRWKTISSRKKERKRHDRDVIFSSRPLPPGDFRAIFAPLNRKIRSLIRRLRLPSAGADTRCVDIRAFRVSSEISFVYLKRKFIRSIVNPV